MSQIKAQSPPAPDRTQAGPTILRARNVHRFFEMGDSTINILKGVDLTLREGEFIAIEGRSGSGKSTLLHILGGLDALDSGSIEFNGQDYTRHAKRSRDEKWRARAFNPIVGIVLLLVTLLWDAMAIHPLSRALLVAAGILLIALVGLIVWLIVRYVEERPVTRLRNTQFGFVFQFYHLLP